MSELGVTLRRLEEIMQLPDMDEGAAANDSAAFVCCCYFFNIFLPTH
jgi:hypothetical protein